MFQDQKCRHEGVTKAIAVNVNCGDGEAGEQTLKELVRDNVVKVQMRGTIAFYHFPSANVDRTMNDSKDVTTRDQQEITEHEHDDLSKGMDDLQTKMAERLGHGVFDQVNAFDASNSIMDPKSSNAAAKPRSMILIRDDLKLSAVKITSTINTLQKSIARAEVVIENGGGDSVADYVAAINGKVELNTSLASRCQFAGDFGKSMTDEVFTSQLGESWIEESTLLVKALSEGSRIITALMPTKIKDATPAGKKAANKIKDATPDWQESGKVGEAA